MAERPVALVTGGTRGIGRALVEELAATHHVLVGGRNPVAVASVVESLPSGSAFVVDLADGEATERAAASVTRLDLLVHCAGILPPVDVPVRQAWREVLEVNVVAVVALTEQFLPVLRERQGMVVLINSGAGLNAGVDTSGYSGSKFALTSYAQGLRERERGRVRVVSLHPGRVDTDMQRDLQARMGRPYAGHEHLPAPSVARAAMAAIGAPRGSVVETVIIRPEATAPVADRVFAPGESSAADLRGGRPG